MKVLRRVLAVLAVGGAMATAHVACLEPDVQFCSATLICPVTMVCAGTACVTPEQATACDGMVDGDGCMADGIVGTCFDNGCLPAGCGNTRLDQGEVCDDGNTAFGDQCAADCRSTEACGNGVVDTPVGEQCDEGPAGLSGDGCSSRCAAELLLWRDGIPPLPATRAGYRVAWTGTQLVLAGGVPIGGSVPIGDQWRRDGVTWVKDTPATPLPPRSRFGMAYDAARGEVVAFGGFGTGGTPLADTWVLAGGTWQQKSPPLAPSPRGDVRLSYDPTLERVVLFGGAANSGSASPTLGETWLWDGATWQELGSGSAAGCNTTDSGTEPCDRSNAALVYSEEAARTLLFGGRPVVGGSFTREWQLDSDQTPPWTEDGRQIGSAAQSSTVTAPVTNGVVAISGTTCSLRLGPVWSLCAFSPIDSGGIEMVHEPATSATYLVSSNGRMYPYRASQAWELEPVVPALPQVAAFHPLLNLTVVTSDEPTTRGTWLWTGRSWHPLPVSPSGISRRGGAFAFDTTRGELVHFGGMQSLPLAAVLDDLFVFDGSTYTKRITTNAPPARKDHALAYDEARGELVLFGGDLSINLAQYVGDTWTLAGDTWVERTSVPAPSAREGHAMAYDPIHQQVVLFGGRERLGVSDETWIWDGTAWSLVPASGEGPVAREEAALVYDPTLGALVLVGGFTPGGWLTDAWLWTGTGWAEAQSITAPTLLVGLAGARDPLGGITMFAGSSQWRLRAEAAGVPAERCETPTLDLDGDGFSGCADPDCWQRCSPLCPPGQAVCAGPRCGDAVCSSIEAGFCLADCP